MTIKQIQNNIQDIIEEIDRLEDLQNRDFFTISQCAKRALGRKRFHNEEVYNTHSLSVKIMRRQEKIDEYILARKQWVNALEDATQNAFSA